MNLGFKLKRPCKDCPFRKTPGDRNDKHLINMGLLIKPLIDSNAMHSCHMTDPRSDYEPAKEYKGEVQHCVGMILMCEKSGAGQMPYLEAWVRKKFEIKDLEGSDEVMNLQEFGSEVYRAIITEQGSRKRKKRRK